MRNRSRSAIAVLLISFAFGTIWLSGQQSDDRQLAALFPAGALLYLEAKDLRGLVTQWSSSNEKRAWLSSDNFGILSRSRLVQRLGEARDQFATVAGIPVAFNLLEELSGSRSAFAFYDLANLKFVYLTNLQSSRLDASELWRSRTKYQQRSVAGTPFYLDSDAASHRTIAFARFKDWFIISTAEEQMARTLALVSGSQGAALSTEPWFSDVTTQARLQGDLRLVYHLDALLPTPQFRTYWLQQNTSALKEFTSGTADLFNNPNVFEEQRVLLRRTPETLSSSAPSLSSVLQYVPPSSSLSRAWVAPDRSLLTETLQQVVLGESVTGAALDRMAPQISLENPNAGVGSDFETRIDQPPFRKAQSESVRALADAVMNMQPVELLHVQATVPLNDNVFVTPQSGVVIECLRPDRVTLEQSLSSVTGILRTGSLDPLHVSLSGNALILARLPIARATGTAWHIPQGATYAAMFDRRVEWPRYKQLFNLIDRTAKNPETTPGQNTPAFFSGNVQSLGEVFSPVQRASIIAQGESSQVRETIRYELSAP